MRNATSLQTLQPVIAEVKISSIGGGENGPGPSSFEDLRTVLLRVFPDSLAGPSGCVRLVWDLDDGSLTPIINNINFEKRKSQKSWSVTREQNNSECTKETKSNATISTG